MADTLDLGSSAERRGGSSPFIRTIKNMQAISLLFCLKRDLNTKRAVSVNKTCLWRVFREQVRSGYATRKARFINRAVPSSAP